MGVIAKMVEEVCNFIIYIRMIFIEFSSFFILGNY